MPHVLIADGDVTSMQQVATLLERARYHVSKAKDGRSTVRAIARRAPDLVLMEVLLPDQEGFEVCRHIRHMSDVPIMFLSTQACSADRVRGLQLGADDYLAKPCAPSELIARIQAVLRRTERSRQPPTSSIYSGGWMLDPIRQACMLADGSRVELTPREIHLLSFLMRRPGRVCTTRQIIHHVWGQSHQQARSIVATSVWRLRMKLEGQQSEGYHILTIRNVGYKFEP